jgi:hypothetical protein
VTGGRRSQDSPGAVQLHVSLAGVRAHHGEPGRRGGARGRRLGGLGLPLDAGPLPAGQQTTEHEVAGRFSGALLVGGDPGKLTAVVVTLREITNGNREAVLALRVAPEQERFVGSVHGALDDAAEYPHAKPWYRAVYAGDDPVGFVMVSWNVQPRPPDIIGPWFLWKIRSPPSAQGL